MAAPSNQGRGNPLRRRLECGQFGDRARRGNSKSVARDAKRFPAETVQVNKAEQMRLRFRKEPGTSGQPRIAIAPVNRTSIGARPRDLLDSCQIHGRETISKW